MDTLEVPPMDTELDDEALASPPCHTDFHGEQDHERICETELEPESEPEPDKLCRICLGSDDGESQNPLFRPCSCSGTMAWVHVQCLDAWRNQSSNPRSFYRCDQCHYEYQFGHAFEMSGMRFGDRLWWAWLLGLPFAVILTSVLALVLLVWIAGFVFKLWMVDTWWQVLRFWNLDHFALGSIAVGLISLVGSCLSFLADIFWFRPGGLGGCLLYTSDAADEEDSVDLGGRRIIKKKKNRGR
eukprot:TRINITY_DN20770_c0_g1_i1.p1 TRINITY_DN20770_c0_g1~~TRINITY_DN20770_c0_g1_i1.p1  ORF type:complete len:242 (-),score=42.77 TRINITY_DN20770_c0_g1_i1:72-797(-)